MTTGFFSLPVEIRTAIYRELLVASDAFKICLPNDSFCHIPHHLSPSILGVNKRAYDEANFILYLHNRFEVCSESPERLDRFLDQIGLPKASLVQHLSIPFPWRILWPKIRDIKIKANTLRLFDIVREKFINLKRLETSLESGHMMELAFWFNRAERINEARFMLRADELFKTIVSLEEVIVNLRETSPWEPIRRLICAHGWTIQITPREPPA